MFLKNKQKINNSISKVDNFNCPRNSRDKDVVVNESFEWRIRQRAAGWLA